MVCGAGTVIFGWVYNWRATCQMKTFYRSTLYDTRQLNTNCVFSCHFCIVLAYFISTVIQEHSENVDLRQDESGLDPESVSGVRTTDPDCRNSGWLPKANGDFLVQSYICGEIFMKIRSAVFIRKVADRQADRKTNKRRGLHNLFGGVKNSTCRFRLRFACMNFIVTTTVLITSYCGD